MMGDRQVVLIVDDSESVRLLFRRYLKADGITNVALAASAHEALNSLGIGESTDPPLDVDLILMDLVMPGINGIEACRRIKASEQHQDIPIIMVTSVGEVDTIKKALDSGAADYITKPPNKIELMARVRSALRLKQETDRRKAREKELEERNLMLERLSYLDGLTGLANRRYFDESMIQEWRRSLRERTALSLLMIDIDHFKSYNDNYGHQQGDDCLRRVSTALGQALKRPGDFAARYGGEEFAIVLPNTDADGAMVVAETLRENVAELRLPNPGSQVSDQVTVSVGVCSLIPEPGVAVEALISAADKALYTAKSKGRNQVRMAGG